MVLKFIGHLRRGPDDSISESNNDEVISTNAEELHSRSIKAGASYFREASDNASYDEAGSHHSELAKQTGLKSDEVRVDRWYDGFVRLVIWYPSYLPKKEKLMLFKIDVVLLLYVCASYFTKALDKSNITKAYNANMDKDIGFGGNNLSDAKSLYSAGYIVSGLFGTLLVTRPRARLLLPLLETIWGVLTFCQAACTTPSQILALRFLIGLAEGPIFPSVVYTVGSWYKRDEVYRRIMAFAMSSSIGGMLSGFVQSGGY